MDNSNSLNEVSEQFYREARKLEIRLGEYLNEEETFVAALRDCIAQFKLLHDFVEKLAPDSETKKIGEALALKLKSEEAFSKAVMQQGEAEHERSHLLESYGALILALQKLEDELTAAGSGAKKPADTA